MKRRLLALLAVGLIALGAVGGRVVGFSQSQPSAAAAAANSAATTTSASTITIDQATEQAYAGASKSVVYIVSQGLGSGSGIIYDTNGDIVTNNHVVDGAKSISVTLNNGKSYSATVVGTDTADDLAVIRIHASNLTAATFAKAGSYRVGQTVLAIGNPIDLKQSVTSGLISGVHRVEQEPNGAYLADTIQTSAAINPGNSGGALVTLDGTVVGMPTLEQTSSSDGTTTQGIGFAIPSERIVSIVNQIVATGKVEHTGRAYLGIAPRDASSQAASPFGYGGFGPRQTTPTTSGAVVSQISSSGPAARAGVQQGDVITGVDGTTIADAQDLLTVLASKKPGDTITLKLDRNGSTQSVQVQLGELPA
jgi:putative serine protease PepD